MKKIVFIIICILAGIILGGQFVAQKESTNQSPTQTPKTVLGKRLTPTPPPVGEHINSPEQLLVPRLGIQAAIELVGLDPEGRMDVPKDDDNVAWYSLGFKPGEKGSAVLAGHFDRRNGGPAVFYRLEELVPGDEIIITGDNGEKLTYVVTGKELYSSNNFPLEEVFNSTDKSRLNLITCDGVWNPSTQNYSQRLVVFSELSPAS